MYKQQIICHLKQNDKANFNQGSHSTIYNSPLSLQVPGVDKRTNTAVAVVYHGCHYWNI